MSSAGGGEAGRLALLHGFTQTGRSWAPLRGFLEGRFEVVAPDLSGHGARSTVPADLWDTARLLARECGEASYLGYSMGARVGLHLALARPELVRRLVLVGVTPGIEDDGERVARRRADEELAQSLERDGLDPFLERWLSQPLFDGLSAEAAGVPARRENTVAGLAACLRRMGTGTQETLWRRLPELTMPVLVVAGERDTRFAELAARTAEGIGANASAVLVAGAGHACHLESPEAFLEVVLPFVSSA